MRLRLHILRNDLPAVKVMWNTTSLKPGVDEIVSNLLNSINDIIPLEGSSWGLEDYVVELGGFEVLHFQEISAVFKEDDEVVIRPLSGSEVKQRRLSGRRQISSGGRKLLDGTPFGRPHIRPAPDRPRLLIPSAKRHKSGKEEETSTLELDADEEDEEDEDYVPITEADNTEDEEEPDATSRNALVRFAAAEIPDSDEEDEDDSDFNLSSSDSGVDSENEDEDEDENKITEDSEEEEPMFTAENDIEFEQQHMSDQEQDVDGIQSDAASERSLSSSSEASDSDSSSESSSSESDKSRSSSDDSSEDESSEDEVPEVRPSKRSKTEQQKPTQSPKPSSAPAKGPATAPGSLPFQAKPATKSRNVRKKLTNVLKRLQKEKLVPEHFTLTQLKDHLAELGLDTSTPARVIGDAIANKPWTEKVDGRAGEKEPEKDDSVKEQESVQEPPQNEAETSKPKKDNIRITKAHRRAFKRAVQSGEAQPGTIKKWLQLQGIISQEPSLEMQEGRKILEPKLQQSVDVTQPENLGLSTYGKSNKKWKQLRNKAPTKIIYGEDGSVITTTELEAPIAPEPEHEPIRPTTDPEAWRSKIWLSAVECEQEGVALPAPDFPFRQQQLQWNGGMNPGKKRKRNNKRQQAEDHHHDEYQQQDVGMLDYGDEPSANPAASAEEDLPGLPDDIGSLEPLTLPVLPGTIVAFRRFAINYKTMTPEYMPHCTAIVETVHTDIPDGPLLELRLAIRDRVQPEIDETTGEKIMGKFDMPGYEKEEESGYLEMMFGELLEAKIVKLPEPGKEPVKEHEEQRPKHDDEVANREPGESVKEHDEQGPKHDGDVANNDPEELDYGDDIYMGDESANASIVEKEASEQGDTEEALPPPPPVQEKVDQEMHDFIPLEESYDDEAIAEDEPEKEPIPMPEPLGDKEPTTSAQKEAPHTLSPAPRSSVPASDTAIPTNGHPISRKPSPKPSPRPESRQDSAIFSPPRIPIRTPARTPPPAQSPTPSPEPEAKSKPKAPVYEIPTDSDEELPTLQTILTQHFSSQPPVIKKESSASSQLPDIKREFSTQPSSASKKESPQLPKLPEFSPLGIKVTGGDEDVLSQRQILNEAGVGGGKKKKKKSVEIISLLSSSPDPQPAPRRQSPWKVVRSSQK